MVDWGFIRVTAASHPTRVADASANADSCIQALRQFTSSDVVVFGELSLSGYTCGDLFAQDTLLSSCVAALEKLAAATQGSNQIIAVGLPLSLQDRLYNCAAVLCNGRVIAVIPKQYLPNYQEFYEARWFASADGSEPKEINLGSLGEVPFGIDLLISRGPLKIGVEICEDLWMPVPPSSLQACAGANLILNLSASNELIGKAQWRETLVRSQAGRCIAAYAYASCGPSESTTDIVFGGHCLVVENGALLAESTRVGKSDDKPVELTSATADIDLQRLSHDRRQTGSWQIAAQRTGLDFRTIELEYDSQAKHFCQGELRHLSGRPFVPSDEASLHDRCAEIVGIQCAALAKRISRLPKELPLSIGISGGLDSTLALLVAVKTCQMYGWPTSRIAGLTMPGYGTTSQTLSAAHTLMDQLGITSREVDIKQLCLDTFLGLGHKPFGIEIGGMSLSDFEVKLKSLPANNRNDLVFENVQARIRTMLLMNHGFVLGTGDLSEQALGWSTYNGDHMSMYNVNTSIPKTLVRFLVRYLANHRFDGPARQCLLEIAAAPITPELLPTSKDGKVLQKTEDTIGAYELHDFYLYHMLRFGTSPRKLLHLTSLAKFEGSYTTEQHRTTLKTFLQRFFSNQFKRSCVPDGPKVGSISLSPRGDWRMPSDAEVTAWLSEME